MKHYQDAFRLNRKTAFVCGGAGTIGREIVRAFVEAGARVIILDVEDRKGQEFSRAYRKKRLGCAYEHFDATDLEAVESRITNLAHKYHRIDVWVNATYPRTNDWADAIEKASLESWRKNIDMHMTSYNWISRCVCLLMKKQKSGSLINLGSIYGVLGNDASLYGNTGVTAPPAYAAIKGGIVNMTRYLASFFGKYNIRVNTICPGGIYTNQYKAFVKKYVTKTPLRRMATAEDVAAAALYFASDASAYVTGTTFMVDGGYSCI